jgi:Fur family ferric uptake transcriptional regulator
MGSITAPGDAPVSTGALQPAARSSQLPTGPLAASLARAGVRVTEPRLAVARLVAAREGHFTASELIDDARRDPGRIGRATIFRSLELFTSLGLVERVDLPDGTHAWVACEDVHHHHAICTTCGRSFDVQDQGLVDTLAAIGRRTGFHVTSHRLEVFGICAGCIAAAGS